MEFHGNQTGNIQNADTIHNFDTTQHASSNIERILSPLNSAKAEIENATQSGAIDRGVADEAISGIDEAIASTLSGDDKRSTSTLQRVREILATTGRVAPIVSAITAIIMAVTSQD